MAKNKTISMKLKLSKGELEVVRHISKKPKSIYNKAISNIKKHYQEEHKFINKYDGVVKEPDYTKTKFFPFSFSYIGSRYENGKRYFKIPLAVPYKRFLKEISSDPNDFIKHGVDPNLFGIPKDYFFKITLPRKLYNKKIQEVTIIPLNQGHKFEMRISYYDDNQYLIAKGNEKLSIDLGVNNLFPSITNGKSFIIDGKRLKSMNQYFNKKLSYLHKTNPYVLRGKVDPVFNELRYVKDLKTNLAYKENFKHYTTKRMLRLYEKRDNKINDYIYKACNMVINYCLNNNVTTIVLGYNKAFQVLGFKYPDNYELLSNIKKHYIKNIVQENNQKFNTIPFGKIKNRLNYLSNLHGINFIIQEESYTSDSSFLDTDDIPIYKKEDTNVYTF